MRFLSSFFTSALVFLLAYAAAAVALIDAPIAAEYWVPEMITIKRELVKNYQGQRKIVIAGGSSALFGFDAAFGSDQLDVPVLNFGLHAGMKLDKILREAGGVVEHGDLLILSLEPPHFNCGSKLSSWQVTNIIAWDHATWRRMSYPEKAELVSYVRPALLGDMAIARMQKRFFPESIGERLIAFDGDRVLEKFHFRALPSSFEYSAFNLDGHGDLLQTDGGGFKGKASDTAKPNHLCDKTANRLADFVGEMKRKGVLVYFANAPYVASGDLDSLRAGERSFRAELSRIAPIVDRREDLVFDRKYFFDTALHLNAQGRFLRTELFVKSMREMANCIRREPALSCDTTIKPGEHL